MIYNGSDKHKQALFENKQDKLTAGDNISLTPQQDGTVRIDADGGGSGTVTDVQMNGVSIVDANKIASFNNYVELTRAEWEALPDSKYTDDILYCIKDGGSEKSNFFSPIIYSLAEREVGVWCDGKPLYARTFTSKFINDSGTYKADISCDFSTVDKVVYSKAQFLNSTASSAIPYCAVGNDLIYYWYSKTDNKIYVRSTTNRTAYDVNVTLYYTKTTDNPGTGKWTTSGVPAHHYSTDEQVIGTWFGETLYEKTVIVSYTDFAYDANVSNGRSYDPYNVIGNNANLINIYPIATSNLYRITPGFSINNYDSSNNYWGLKMTYHKVVLYSSGGWTIIENHVKPTVYITIQYTKSS